MEDYRLIQIEEEFEDEDEDEEDEDEEDYDEGEYEEDLIPVGIISPRHLNFTFNAGEEEYDDEEEEEDDDDDEDEEEDYEEGEEGEELIPLARMIPAGSIEDEDYEDEFEDEDDEDYEDEDEDDEDYEEEEVDDDDYEEEEVEELIPVELMSPRVSSSISHVRTLQGPVVINEGLLADSESCEGKPPGDQKNAGGDGGKEELNRGEIDGLFCPICFEAWTSGGEHQICCLPCGHIYGLSCIKKWLQRRRSSGKCPQCNNLCTLNDVRVLYGTPVCVADEELEKRVRSLEARCSCLEQKAAKVYEQLTLHDEYLVAQHKFTMQQHEFIQQMRGAIPEFNMPPLPLPPPPPPPLIIFDNATTSSPSQVVRQEDNGAERFG